MKTILTSIIVVTFLTLTGCDSTPTEVEDYDPEAVLSGFLYLGRPVEEIRLERVASLYLPFEGVDHGIAGADMKIFAIGSVDTLYLVEDASESGRYVPDTTIATNSMTPQALITYRIEVTTPQDEFLWAEALMPGAMEEHGPVEIILTNQDGVEFPVSDGDTLNRTMPNLTWSWSDVDSVAGFQGMALCLTPRDSLVPLDPDWDPNDPDDEIEEEDRDRIGWGIYRKDQRSIKIFWMAFPWIGWYNVEMLALSQSYYDYLFSLFRVDQGLINEPTSNINGGIGIFACVSTHSMRIYMEKAQL